MSARRVIRAAAVVAIPILAFGTGFATNVLSAAPRVATFMKHYGWWILAADLALSVILQLFFKEDRPSKNEGSSDKSVNIGRAGTVVVNTHAATPEATQPIADHGSAPSPTVIPSGRSGLVYSQSAFLNPDGWEARTNHVLSSINPDALFVPLSYPEAELFSAAAVVLAFSASFFPQVREDTIARLKQARAKQPSARILLISVGYADSPISDQKFRNMLRAADMENDDNIYYMGCSTLDELEEQLTGHLPTALRIKNSRDHIRAQRMLGKGGTA